MIINLITRLINRLKRSLRSYGLSVQVRQIERWPAENTSIGKLLIIGPGVVTVPPKGWGAVETIIAETIPTYTNSGIEVMLINSKALQDWYRGLKFEPDVVLVHDDIATRRAAIFYRKARIISITHYGLAEFADLWHPSYRKVLRRMNWADTVIALNQRIPKVLEEYLHKPKIIVSSNGTNFLPRTSDEEINKLICIGKVESRKRQFEIFSSLQSAELQIDFIGEVVDERVIDLLRISSSARSSFKGPYNRSQLREVISKYRALLLLSDGEGDALVLYEAQAAGLPIIVSPSSLGDQDDSLPWIRVVSHNAEAAEIICALNSISSSKESIAAYARQHYKWSMRNSRLVNEVIEQVGFK